MDSKVRNEIEENHLLSMLLKCDTDSGSLLLALCEMGSSAVGAVDSLLKKLGSMESLEEVRVVRASLFLIQFLLNSMKDDIDPKHVKKLEEQELGFQVFLLLPEELQKVYKPLVSKPYLVFESMLMDKRLVEARSLLKSLKHMRSSEKEANSASVVKVIDSIIVEYARKALQEFRDGNNEDEGEGSSTKIEGQAPVARLRVDDDGWNAQARTDYAYKGTPDVDLAKAILDLGHDRIGVGVTCIDFCRELSCGLTEQTSRGIETIDVILRILIYAKGVLQRENEYSDEAGKKRMEALMSIESFISGAELFGTLLRNRCAYGLSLPDILQPVKARWLRDKLIESDMLNLAIDVATRCNLSAGKVWEHWGFAMLSIGNYPEAREKFRHCLRSYKRRGIIDDDSDPQELLGRIIDVKKKKKKKISILLP